MSRIDVEEKNHRERKAYPSWPQRQQALAARDIKVAWLRKKGKTEAAIRLAEKLDGCQVGKRCGSAACDVCTAVMQHGLARAIFNLAEEREGQVFTLTIIPESSFVAKGELAAASHTNHVRRLKRALGRTNVTWLAGATDFSLNEDQTQDIETLWCPHVHLIGAARDLQLLREQLRVQFPASDRVPRPIMLRAWDWKPWPLLYSLKPHFVRRVTTYGSERFVKELGELRECRNTSKQRLRSAELLELMMHLDSFGIRSRVFLLKCQLHIEGHSYTLRLV